MLVSAHLENVNGASAFVRVTQTVRAGRSVSVGSSSGISASDVSVCLNTLVKVIRE